MVSVLVVQVVLAMQALLEEEPAGAVVPLGQLGQAVEVPPGEKVFCGHVTQRAAERYWPPGQVAVAGVVQAALEVLPGAEVCPEGQAVHEAAPVPE